MKNTPREAARDMVKALKEVFKKYSLNTRTSVWDTLTSEKGKKAMRVILIHPDKPTSPVLSLDFKEWIIAEALRSNEYIQQIAKQAKINIEGLDLKQLRLGLEVEREHDGRRGKDTKVVEKDGDILKIAVAHLRELPDYYNRLGKMEKEGKLKFIKKHLPE